MEGKEAEEGMTRSRDDGARKEVEDKEVEEGEMKGERRREKRGEK